MTKVFVEEPLASPGSARDARLSIVYKPYWTNYDYTQAFNECSYLLLTWYESGIRYAGIALG